MRRLALSLLTMCGLAALAACSGGSGFSSGTSSDVPTAVVLYAGNTSQLNGFAVVPGGNAPLLVSATAYKGPSYANNIIPGETFTWAGRFVNPLTDPTSVSTYTVGPSPNGFKTCPAKPATTPAVPILMQAGTGAASSLYPGYTLLPATATAAQVYVGPVPGVTPPYCLVIQATSSTGGIIGAHTVIVSASP